MSSAADRTAGRPPVPAREGAVLVVLDAVPLPLTEGDRLRSFHLSRALGTATRCLLAVPACGLEQLAALRESGPFDDVLLLPPRPQGGDPRRLLRTDNGWFLRRGWPDWFAQIQRQLQTFIADEAVHTVVAGKLPVAELLAGLPHVRRVLDDFDCYTLTLERELAAPRRRLPTPGRLKALGATLLALLRYRRQESRLHRYFDLVTTISPADAARLRSLDPAAAIEVVPNGVAEGLLALPLPPTDSAHRGVAFWGNLGFEPNHSAVRWFIEEVYAPFLADRHVPCTIIGRGADAWIDALPRRFGAVRVTGFVEDLPGLVGSIPVMINPMVSGSGLKNKMLEAMALGRAVVSTAMGAEALAVSPDEHFRQADTPRAFADQVLDLYDHPDTARDLGARARRVVAEHYTWPQVEARWRQVLLAERTAGVELPGSR